MQPTQTVAAESSRLYHDMHVAQRPDIGLCCRICSSQVSESEQASPKRPRPLKMLFLQARGPYLARNQPRSCQPLPGSGIDLALTMNPLHLRAKGLPP